MPYRILIASVDAALAGQAIALIREDPELEVVGTATTETEIAAAIDDLHPEAVLLHEGLGALSVIDVARSLAARYPWVGLVLAVRGGGTEILRPALQAGARDVLELPLTLEELETGIKGAAKWSRALRPSADDGAEERGAGRVVVLAGAKGGVGTTTIAVHLALATTRRGRQSVCLVDLDLQAGDVASLLDVAHHRSVLDLVDVGGEVSAPQLESTVYRHPSGLRVLLAPEQGERAEELTAAATRGILGGLRSTYDLVVVDAGTQVTEAGAVAVEIASEVLVVVTPDVPAVRAANRLASLWERLGVGGVERRVLINRAARTTEVQPDLLRKVVELPVAPISVPAGFRQLEAAANSGSPDRLAPGAVKEAVEDLARDVAAKSASQAQEPTPRRRSLRSETGQVAAETAAITGMVMVVALLLWQMVLAGFTYVLAGHAARESARQVAVGRPAETAAREDLPESWRRSMQVSQGGNWVEVSLAVPALVPGIDTSARVATRAGTVREETGGGP